MCAHLERLQALSGAYDGSADYPGVLHRRVTLLCVYSRVLCDSRHTVFVAGFLEGNERPVAPLGLSLPHRLLPGVLCGVRFDHALLLSHEPRLRCH